MELGLRYRWGGVCCGIFADENLATELSTESRNEPTELSVGVRMGFYDMIVITARLIPPIGFLDDEQCDLAQGEAVHRSLNVEGLTGGNFRHCD